MRKRTKYFLWTALVILCLTLSGCKNRPDSSSEAPSATATPNAAIQEGSDADANQEASGADTMKETSDADTMKETSGADTMKETSDADDMKEPSAQETKALSITIINLCGADIGMFSVIDPVTGEQVNLNSLSNEESMTIEANWPVDTSNFQWAVYNQDGNLYMEGSTDITAADTAVFLSLTGNGSIDHIEEAFQ